MSRWVQLGLGLVAMMAISSPQYVWTLFVKPFQTTTGEALPAIQWICQNFASLPFGSPCSDQSLRKICRREKPHQQDRDCLEPGKTAYAPLQRHTEIPLLFVSLRV
jgi:hypothetical protein